MENDITAAPKIISFLLFAVAFFVKLCYNNISRDSIEKGGVTMPNIKPVSDLRNYNEVLRDIAVGQPVFLTKNGRGRYVIVDMDDYEKQTATLKLLAELAKGEQSAAEQGWLSPEDVERELGLL